MVDSRDDARSLLSSLRSSRDAQLFVNEAKRVLGRTASAIKREFVERLSPNDYLSDMRGVPRIAKQEIERLCQNKGDIAGSKKLLEVVFRYEKNVFYEFMELVINNNQSDLFTNLFSVVQQRNQKFSAFRFAGQTNSSLPSGSVFSQQNQANRILVDHPVDSYDTSTSPTDRSQPRYLSRMLPADDSIQISNQNSFNTLGTSSYQDIQSLGNPADRSLLVVDHPEGSYEPSVSPSQRSQPRYLSRGQSADLSMQNADQRPANMQVSGPRSDLSSRLPADFDINELYELRNLRRRVEERFGSVENFYSSLDRTVRENVDDPFQPGAFNSYDFENDQQ